MIQWKTAGNVHIFQSPGNSLINTFPVSDSLDSLSGPGGCLLVVSHLFAVLVLVLWVGFEKNN